MIFEIVVVVVVVVVALAFGFAARVVTQAKHKSERAQATAEAKTAQAEKCVQRAAKMRPQYVYVKPLAQFEDGDIAALKDLAGSDAFRALIWKMREESIARLREAKANGDVGNRELGRIDTYDAVLEMVGGIEADDEEV